jgi:hypothetical protein
VSTETTGDDLPEIRVEAYDKIDQWREKLDETEKLKKRDVFERAAADLFLEAEYERDLRAIQAITDAVYFLGRDHAGLCDDDIQYVMASAKAKAERRPTNGSPLNDFPLLRDAGEGSQTDPRTDVPSKKALTVFPLVAFKDVQLDLKRRNHLIKGLLPRSGFVVIWGPPKCYKSFWAMDLALHIALGWEYRGRRVHQAPVVYITLEGREGLPARKTALAQYYDIGEAPLYFITTTLNLAKQAHALSASIEAQLGDIKPGAVFIDTLNRSLVGSESKDEDMAAYLAGAGYIEQKFNCLIPIVHHCGIDASRPRGHTSLTGAVEVQLRVERAGDLQALVTVEFAKDIPEGAEIASRLERVDLGTDADGDPITSLVVLPVEGPIQRTVTRKLSPRQQLALAALDECAASSGIPAPASLELPARTVVVQLNTWREELYRKGVLDRDAKSPREEFKRVRMQLQARALIGVNGELVWKA